MLLGSNCGNRLQYIVNAKLLIAEKIGAIEKESLMYETAPWGNNQQDSFLNQSILIFTELQPDSILLTIKQIENEVGRTATFQWGPREIDIDILMIGDVILNTVSLQIPHAQLHFRNFALVPLNEIAADAQHPVLQKTVATLLEQCPDTSAVYPLENIYEL
jgi:2-amino-4-hydroxy-6-hydroxymethyldihydropteridine diphosphokinase